MICRQRLGTAKGFVPVSREDGTGIANGIVAPAFSEERRLLLSHEACLLNERTLDSGVDFIRFSRLPLGGPSSGDLPPKYRHHHGDDHVFTPR